MSAWPNVLLQQAFLCILYFSRSPGSVPSRCSGRRTRTRADSCVVPSQLASGSSCSGLAQASSSYTMFSRARRKLATAVIVQPSLTWSPHGSVEETTWISTIACRVLLLLLNVVLLVLLHVRFLKSTLYWKYVNLHEYLTFAWKSVV